MIVSIPKLIDRSVEVCGIGHPTLKNHATIGRYTLAPRLRFTQAYPLVPKTLVFGQICPC